MQQAMGEVRKCDCAAKTAASGKGIGASFWLCHICAPGVFGLPEEKGSAVAVSGSVPPPAIHDLNEFASPLPKTCRCRSLLHGHEHGCDYAS
jgi:hypothetical protein